MFRLNLWTQNPWGFPPPPPTARGYPPPGCIPPLPPPHPVFPGFPWMETTTTSIPSHLASPALMILATTAEAAAAANQGGLSTSSSSSHAALFNHSDDTKNPDGSRSMIPPSLPPPLPSNNISYQQNGNQQPNLPMFSPPSVMPSHVACPQFVPPGAQQAIISPTGGGAFKPIDLSRSDSDPGSAFVAVKKLKFENTSEDCQEKPEHRTNEDELIKEGIEDRPTSVGSRSSEGTIPDETRTLRSK